SKSDPADGAKILLRDEPDAIRRKIMRAVTDSGKGVTYDLEKKPAVSNLMALYHHATGKTMKDIEKEFAGAGYGDFKKAVADAVIGMLEPMQKRMTDFRKDPAELARILDTGRDAATAKAETMMRTVRERVGLGRG
ncbi:tryptophan--tRNA ligase, partial [Candidatus Uhrbacteria bacterium]|nr:tryptophan--tRNA ligase [Candidatus Uhrbacteria bacterium]